MVRTAPVVAVLFLVPALSLVGHPAAVGLRRQVRAVRRHGGAAGTGGSLGVATVVALLTLFSMAKIWIDVFWAAADEAAAASTGPGTRC